MLEFKLFKKSDFHEYKNWFKDINIQQSLYGIDEEWLEYILNDTTGIEYAIFHHSELVAVIGISFPTDLNPFFVIQNFAVNPKYHRTGIGTIALNKLLQLHPITLSDHWVAFVEKKNIKAQKFFNKNGWEELEDPMDKKMIKFQKKS